MESAEPGRLVGDYGGTPQVTTYYQIKCSSADSATSTLQHFNTSTHYRRSPDGDRIFHRRVAEIRRFFFGGPSRWMLVYETPKNLTETLKDRRAGSPGRRLSMHSKKLRLTWSANHLVRSGTTHLPSTTLFRSNFNTSTLQHLNTLSEVA